MNQRNQSRLFDIEDYLSFANARSSSAAEYPVHPRELPVQLRLVVGPQELVEEFHLAFGLPISSEPSTDVPGPLAQLRKRLLSEEVGELGSAIDDGDISAIARELADVIYVAYGTAVTYGIDLDAVLAEIHRANMSKLDENGDPIVRDDGKVLKGPSYMPPDVDAVLGPSRKS